MRRLPDPDKPPDVALPGVDRVRVLAFAVPLEHLHADGDVVPEEVFEPGRVGEGRDFCLNAPPIRESGLFRGVMVRDGFGHGGRVAAHHKAHGRALSGGEGEGDAEIIVRMEAVFLLRAGNPADVAVGGEDHHPSEGVGGGREGVLAAREGVEPGEIPLADVRVVGLVAGVVEAGEVVVGLVVAGKDADHRVGAGVRRVGDGEGTVGEGDAVGGGEGGHGEVAAGLPVAVAEGIDRDAARGFVPAGRLHVAVGGIVPEEEVDAERGLVIVVSVVVEVEVGDFEVGIDGDEAFGARGMEIRAGCPRSLPGHALFHEKPPFGVFWVEIL